jgi:glycosyltransferase involved in cell wall biosynthesis
MMHLLINALAASAGGGVTYIRNLIPQLSKRGDVDVTVLLNTRLRNELQVLKNVSYLGDEEFSGGLRRFWREQILLPALIRRSSADVLLSVGNFALRNSPIPQILLSRNALYTSADFNRDLLSRRHYTIWLDTKLKSVLARHSVMWADYTVAPSHAFAAELKAWTGREVIPIHHGFDREFFCADATPLPHEVESELNAPPDALRLLFVSHYNYYRNFETLLRAVPLIHQKLAPRPLKLVLTCKLRSKDNPGSYRAETAASLIETLGIRDCVVELGSIPYRTLHRVYRSCDVYVTPAYTETFAHPLVEAMACGLPVVASDLPVHREICGEGALYFDRFSEQALAERIVQIAQSQSLYKRLGQHGLKRSSEFSWERHATSLIELAKALLNRARAMAA